MNFIPFIPNYPHTHYDHNSHFSTRSDTLPPSYSYLNHAPLYPCHTRLCYFISYDLIQHLSRVICDLLSHLRTARLGYESDDKVLQHEYFDGIDFKTLYMGPGPFAVEFCGAGDTRYLDILSLIFVYS